MRILIVEDDPVSSALMEKFLSEFGDCDKAENGNVAMDKFEQAIKSGECYNLVCLDIMMPGMDGHETLRQIRRFEEEWGYCGASGVRIVMTTALDDYSNIMEAFKDQCDAYLVKPIEREKLLEVLRSTSLIEG